jgi:hypothetical protein
LRSLSARARFTPTVTKVPSVLKIVMVLISFAVCDLICIPLISARAFLHRYINMTVKTSDICALYVFFIEVMMFAMCTEYFNQIWPMANRKGGVKTPPFHLQACQFI